VPTIFAKREILVGTARCAFAHLRSPFVPASPRKKPHAVHHMIANVEFSMCETLLA
jgi:hypothetical protein